MLRTRARLHLLTNHLSVRAQVTRRFAEFLTALHCLNVDLGSHQVAETITHLQRNMDNLLKKLAQQHRQLQDRLVFHINNYFHILSVLEVPTFHLVFGSGCRCLTAVTLVDACARANDRAVDCHWQRRNTSSK